MKNEDVENRIDELFGWVDEVQRDTIRLHRQFAEAHGDAMRTAQGIREDADKAIRAAIAEVRADRMWTIYGTAFLAGFSGGMAAILSIYFLFWR